VLHRKVGWLARVNTVSSHSWTAVPIAGSQAASRVCSQPASFAARQWSQGVPISLGPMTRCRDLGWLVMALSMAAR
jgi:hypothetical protein